MNIYKNGYLAHFLIGIIISLAVFDFGWEWSLALTGIVGARRLRLKTSSAPWLVELSDC